MAPFIRLSRSPSEPGEAFKDPRYDLYLFIAKDCDVVDKSSCSDSSFSLCFYDRGIKVVLFLHIQVQDLLLEYGLDNVAETLVEGLSRVKRCTDEGRALMSLDLQVLINGLKHFVSVDVRPKLQIVETFIKAYYLPETEFVHWSRAHPEYSKSQVVGLVNLVATMKGWKRKTRLEVLEKIE
nr:syndetin isoform X2 [Ipomoea batatas]